MREAQGQARKRRSRYLLISIVNKVLGESGRNREVAIAMPELGNDVIFYYVRSFLTD
jgi:hypothetical protein